MSSYIDPADIPVEQPSGDDGDDRGNDPEEK